MSLTYVNTRLTRPHLAVLLHKSLLHPLALVFLGVWVALMLMQDQSSVQVERALVFLGLMLFAWHVLDLFSNDELEDDTEPRLSSANLAGYLSFGVLKHIPVFFPCTPHALFKAAVRSRRGRFLLDFLGANPAEVLKAGAATTKQQLRLSEFLEQAEATAVELKQPRLDGHVLLYTFFKQGGVFEDLLNGLDVSIKDVRQLLNWEDFHERNFANRKRFGAETLMRTFGTVGRSWVQGYTNELDLITTDISQQVVWRSVDRGIMVHKDDLDTAVQVITRASQRNLLIIGEVGSGKQSMMENTARLLRRHELEKSLPLTSTRLLNVERVLSGVQESDKVLLKALEKAKGSGKFLIVMENVATFMRSSDANLRSVLTKFLRSHNLAVMGMITPEDYHTYVKTDPVFDDMFEKIYLSSTDETDTMAVLMARLFELRRTKKISCTYRTLQQLVQLTERYLGKGAMPGKAVEVLDDAALKASKAKGKVLTETHIRDAVSLKAHLDVSELGTDERDRLLKLDKVMKKSVVGQNEAVEALVNTLKRARMDIGTRERPLGTFLFLGPTGVGKTHTAKVLAEEYFGNISALIRVDMNEYGTEDSVVGIIGDPHPGKNTESFLTKRVQENPFSLILLDEIEKAHPKVLNVFLQILDEGHLIDSRGVKTDFKNTIIICTSNAGALFIRDFITAHKHDDKETFKTQLVDTIIKQRTFSPEFINRFDELILYYPLEVPDAIRVALLMLDDIVKEIAAERGYKIFVEEDVVVDIVKQGYSIEFGAREMRRVIMEKIENFLADYLLKNEVKRGDEIRINREDLATL